MTFHTSTTFFDGIDAFVAIVETALSPLSDPWSVFDGDPREGTFNWVAAITGATNWSQSPAGIGAGSPSFPLDEDYEITARLACWDGTITQSTSRNSIKAAFQAIETGVRADPTLGGIALWSYLATNEYEQGATDASGSSAQLDITLYVTARIH